MKLTKNQLKQLIREELSQISNKFEGGDDNLVEQLGPSNPLATQAWLKTLENERKIFKILEQLRKAGIK